MDFALTHVTHPHVTMCDQIMWLLIMIMLTAFDNNMIHSYMRKNENLAVSMRLMKPQQS